MRCLLVVVLVAAFVATVSTGHPYKRSSWKRRPALNLARINCDRIKIAELCHCCKSKSSNTTCPDPCDDVECLNNGVCVNGICNCPSGFSGADCGVDLCAAKPCQNNGTCVPETGGVSCKCADGFSGDNCEIDLCAAKPCQNGGTCVPETGAVSCKCADGFSGDNCEKDVCEPNPCQNCGTCSRLEEGFNCTCLDRTNGTTCEDIDNVITSPNYPNNYPKTTRGLIAIPPCPTKKILVVFDDDFVIQKQNEQRCDPDTSVDDDDESCADFAFLENTGNNFEFFYCGGTAPQPYKGITGAAIVVGLMSNGDGVVCTGFRLTYSYVDE